MSDSFENFLAQAKSGRMPVLELVRAADQLKGKAPAQNIAALYQTWIDHHTNDGLMYAVLFNYSVVLTDMGDLQGARTALEKALELNADFAPIYINLGRIYERLGASNFSLKHWNAALEKLANVNGQTIAHKTTALNQMARVVEGNQQDELAETLLHQSMEIDPHQRDVAQHYLAARQRLCKWPLVQPWDRVSRKALMDGLSPLSAAVFTDDPMFQLAANAHYNRVDVGDPIAPMLSSHWAARRHNKNAPLRIGYLSSDLREHAIGFLMAEVFELHNRKNVEVFVYYCGVIPDDPHMQRIKATVDHWTDINGMDDIAAARRIADDGIQILVDVNGYTRDGRVKILPLHPAPILVNWLGFPGSMASPYHHYIIADDWIIPPEHEIYFSEKVLRLPCYQPNDRKRKIADLTPTREEMGLPKDAVVFCCFNGAQKISKYTFDRWLQILARVPNSVLWLLGGAPDAQKRLGEIAESRGVAANRLIFAGKMKNPEHLARYPLADLFLDTSPYGAHTTASDALWMGVPVITLDGRAFASRVCGSLVRAAGLPELACAMPEEYVDKAVALGKDKSALAEYRTKLAALRETCDLFNTPKLVGHLEKLYQQMWQDFETGKLPQPNLANMDVYFEVGAAQDHDATEILTIPNYDAWWQENLFKRHQFRAIGNDSRLWTAEIQRKMESKEGQKDEAHSGHGWRRFLRLASVR